MRPPCRGYYGLFFFIVASFSAVDCSDCPHFFPFARVVHRLFVFCRKNRQTYPIFLWGQLLLEVDSAHDLISRQLSELVWLGLDVPLDD